MKARRIPPTDWNRPPPPLSIEDQYAVAALMDEGYATLVHRRRRLTRRRTPLSPSERATVRLLTLAIARLSP